MKKMKLYGLSLVALAMAASLGSCADFKPETPELPNLPKVQNLAATVDNRVVTLSWNLPSTSLPVEGVILKVNNNQEINLDGNTTTYAVKGQPMEDEYMYTVKLKYEGGYVSEGESVIATVPFEQLADLVSFSVASQEKREITFAWTVPSVPGVTGVWVGLDGEESGTVFNITDYPTGATLGGNKTGVDLKFRAKVVYDESYYSDGVVVNTALPEMEVRAGYLLLADTPTALPDDDEVAAAAWFYDNYVETDKGDFITVAELPNIDFDEYGVIWIMVDRIGLEPGWEKLPANLISETTLNALKAYGEHGGNLYLAKMATQLTVPLNVVPQDMPVNIFSSGDGGEGGDIWMLNPFLGWDFRPDGPRAGEQGYYNRTEHAIYQGLEFSDPNGWDMAGLPMEGPGWREDHNCMWDINPYWEAAGRPAPDCVKWFENTTNSLVLATWGHVRDHCVAALVEFMPNTVHGRVIANGINCYEFAQNSGLNPYQANVEGLTANIINYLK